MGASTLGAVLLLLLAGGCCCCWVGLLAADEDEPLPLLWPCTGVPASLLLLLIVRPTRMGRAPCCCCGPCWPAGLPVAGAVLLPAPPLPAGAGCEGLPLGPLSCGCGWPAGCCGCCLRPGAMWGVGAGVPAGATDPRAFAQRWGFTDLLAKLLAISSDDGAASTPFWGRALAAVLLCWAATFCCSAPAADCCLASP
jgi:hypothetical protein